MAQGSSADYHLLTVLNKAGLSVHDVTLTYLQPAEGLAALQLGHVDAWDIWSPFIEQAEVQKNAKALVTGTGYGSPYSFAVASRAALADPAKAAAIKDYLALVARRTPGPPPTSRPGRRCGPRRAGCRTAVMVKAARDDSSLAVPITPAVITSEQQVSDAFTKAGLIPVHVDFSDYVVTSFNDTRERGVMTLTFDWFLPTSGDGRTIYGRGHSLPHGPGAGRRPGDRPPDIEYLGQVARAAEQLGFAAVLTPTGTWCEDAWLATAALITETSRLKFLVAFRPGLISPTLAAQMAATLPADLPRPAAAQRGDRGPGRGAAPVRRPPVARRAVRPDRRVPGHRARAPGAGSRSTSPAGTTRSSRPP